MLPLAAPPSPSPVSKPPLSQLTALVTFVVVTGILYFGRDVLIPLALSVLLAFLLAPAVRRLERRGLPRVAATTVMVALSCCVIVGVVWVSATQILSLAASLPEYKSNIQKKIASVRSAPDGSISKAQRTIKEIATEIKEQDAADDKAADDKAAASAPSTAPPTAKSSQPKAEPARPVAVTVEALPQTPLQFVGDLVTPFIVPLAVAGAVIIFTFIILLRREDLRDRLIRLVGHGQLNVTTQVFEEAAERVSRYLRMQLMVNVSYGLPVGIALYAIGVPNAALWGVLAAALRFIPYAGAWIAASMPIALAFAISDGWSLVVWTVAVFLVLELISNNIVEPWAYGASTGMSTIAIMLAAIFWTWLWGAVGLLLAVPLTVVLVVVGRYIPQFAFLSIMLGDEPVLPTQDRVYQRLLARDQHEAAKLAESYVGEHGLEALYDNVLIPVLDLAERDRHADALSEERAGFVFDSMRALVEDLSERPGGDKAKPDMEGPALQREAPTGAVAVCIVPARDQADEIIGDMLLRSLTRRRVRAELLTPDVLKSEVLDKVAELAPQAVYISALPPAAVLHASHFCKRLRPRFPDLKIVVGLWYAQGDLDRATVRLRAAGASEVVFSLKDSIEKLPPTALVMMQSTEPQFESGPAAAKRTSSAPSAT